MFVGLKEMQTIIAYAAIVMGILTTGVVSGVTLPHVASIILGAFGVLLHPDTSVTQTTPKPPAPPVA